MIQVLAKGINVEEVVTGPWQSLSTIGCLERSHAKRALCVTEAACRKAHMTQTRFQFFWLEPCTDGSATLGLHS